MIHTDSKDLSYLRKKLTVFVSEFEDMHNFDVVESSQFKYEFKRKFMKNFVVIPSNTNYVCESFEIPHFTHPDYSKLEVFSKLIQSKFMHHYIREKGGAYGSFCRTSHKKTLTLLSYKDPNYLRTYFNFEKSI